ncbi:DUF1801 domain-containing protein [Pedobacter sp. MW01-1-1]|uniref:DUF1801 domain-containing protein n=1 Tax=Pedobacter sp. MW01-1-1 TaxID=3383027 RepID=UPI003FED8875
MAKNKTTENDLSVVDFLNTIADASKKEDCFKLIELFEEASGFSAKMWGPAIIGFGSYHYVYASKHEGDAPLAAFSPRKNAISLYLSVPTELREILLAKFGKHKTAKSCLYINKLADVDTEVLKELISISVSNINQSYS